MIPKGRGIVTEVLSSSTAVEVAESAALIAVDLWSDLPAGAEPVGACLGGRLPDLGRSAPLAGGWRAIRVEPTVWWLSGPLAGLEAQLANLEPALADSGAATDLSGGFFRIRIRGPHWRDVLMSGGVFDAEDPGFGPGSTAGTILHHAAVRHDVTDGETVDVYVAPSYLEDMLHHLRSALARLGTSRS